MKVILQKDVKGTGKAGDVCEVNDGYARNFLIPRKLALPGDASSINAANIKKQADAHRLEMQRKRAKELAAGMNGLDVDKKKIRLDEPIKALGKLNVTAHLYENADAKFEVEVLPLPQNN